MKTLGLQPRMGRCGFTLIETMISVAVFSVVMAAVITGTTAITGSFAAAENYSVGQLAAVDYLTLDLRRADSYEFTTSGDKLTLPLDLGLPQFYQSDGKTPAAGQRTIVTSHNKKSKKKKHKVQSSRFYYHYGTLSATVAVKYYLVNGALFRREGSLPPRQIGRDIKEVTFTSPAAAANATADQKKSAIEDNPVVTSRIEFLPTKKAKKEAAPLSNSTFMRQYYYSD